KHFTEYQIVEMLSIIGLYGFFNRWNDTLATPLEDGPKAFAEKTIAKAGWTPGKHET
ncbi:MAG: carboxymuconolactone decarboxylase family protein, partial [Rhodospirillaceae bacterium]|nr:carboxymuconolactone decarboxylase family protein [Rhodospirillaceae bacterium]